MAAAADRGRMRDFHDLVALDMQGLPPWVLALAAMGKDAELSPPAILERALRLLKQVGHDDADPDYEGPGIPWAAVSVWMSRRLRQDLDRLKGIQWIDWAGVLPLDRATGRVRLHLEPAGLAKCGKGQTSPSGTWPTSPATTSEMLRRSVHPDLAGVVLDIHTFVDRMSPPQDDHGHGNLLPGQFPDGP